MPWTWRGLWGNRQSMRDGCTGRQPVREITDGNRWRKPTGLSLRCSPELAVAIDATTIAGRRFNPELRSAGIASSIDEFAGLDFGGSP